MPGSNTLVYDFKNADIQISATRMMLEAQKGAAAAEAQLEGDVAQIKAINAARRHFSELVMAVASYATGKTIGTEPEGLAQGRRGPERQDEIPDEGEANGHRAGPTGVSTRLFPDLLHEGQHRCGLLTGATLAASGPEASPAFSALGPRSLIGPSSYARA